MKGAPLSVRISCGNPTKLKNVCIPSTTVTASPLLIGISIWELGSHIHHGHSCCHGKWSHYVKSYPLECSGGDWWTHQGSFPSSCLSSLSGIPHRLETSSHPWSFLASNNVAAIFPMFSFCLSVLTMLTCVPFSASEVFLA